MRDLRFLAGVHAVEAPERVAVFYLMNTSVNRNNWAVTEKALEEALPTILGKPLMCGPAYQTDTHYPEGLEVGRFTGYRKPDGYALAQAVVTDEEAWRRLTRGEWGPISVVITSHRERCSLCGEDLSHNPEPFTHPCLSRGGHLEVESFAFDHVDFISAPAYPQAGFLARGLEAVPLELLAGVAGPPQGKPGGDARGDSSEVVSMEEKEFRAALEGLEERVRRLESSLQGEPKAKKMEASTALEEAMEEARLRLFGRRSHGGR